MDIFDKICAVLIAGLVAALVYPAFAPVGGPHSHKSNNLWLLRNDAPQRASFDPLIQKVQHGDPAAADQLVNAVKENPEKWRSKGEAVVALDAIGDKRSTELLRPWIERLLRTQSVPDREAANLAEYLLMSEKYGQGEKALGDVQQILHIDSRAEVFRAAARRARSEGDTPNNRQAAERYDRLARS